MYFKDSISQREVDSEINEKLQNKVKKKKTLRFSVFRR